MPAESILKELYALWAVENGVEVEIVVGREEEVDVD